MPVPVFVPSLPFVVPSVTFVSVPSVPSVQVPVPPAATIISAFGNSDRANSWIGDKVPPTNTTAFAVSTTDLNRAAASSNTNFNRPPSLPRLLATALKPPFNSDETEGVEVPTDGTVTMVSFSTSTRPSVSADASAVTNAETAWTDPTDGLLLFSAPVPQSKLRESVVAPNPNESSPQPSQASR